MEHADTRNLISQLAEDLSWLEKHSRSQPDVQDHAGRLRLAGALVRNLIGPFLGDQPAHPLHLAVVGGAGAGKSTVANMVSGVVMAESNPQAGFTRHPIAFTSANGQLTWPAHLGFLGPLQRLTEPSPASLDADVYQVRRVPDEEGVATLLDKFVVWDCPDMTTWAATGYVTRLIEISALADVILYVASDERYNDEVPTQFLKLLLQAGKTVVVCLVKMREADAPAFIQHFQQEVLTPMGISATALQTVPHLTADQLTNPVHKAAKYRIPLVNQISVLGNEPEKGRQRSVRSAMNFLIREQHNLMGVARNDMAALQAWRALVQNGQIDFDKRYQQEFLSAERFHRFDEALVRLLELLELPGVGKVVSSALYVVRTPYRWMKGWFKKALRRPEVGPMPEKPVLEGAFNGWMDMLRKETARRTESHGLWAHVSNGFRSGLSDLAKERFDEGIRGFQLGLADEVERTARSIYEELEKNPAALNTLRGTKFALDIGAMGGVIIAGGLSPFDLILAPIAASVTHHLVELLGKSYVDRQREKTRNRQMTMVTQYVSGPLAEWLGKWPATEGSTYERLQIALNRIPKDIQEMDRRVTAKMQQVKSQ